MVGKRIMIVLPSDNLGGAEQYLFNIGNYYSRLGYEIDVFFLYSEKTQKWRDISNANLFFTNKQSEIKGLYPMIRNIQRHGSNKYSFIFSSHQHINALLSVLRSLGVVNTDKLICRESTSVFLRFSGLTLLYFRTLYRFYGKIDLIICQTPEMKQQLLKGYKKFQKYNVQAIRNPIVLDEIKRLSNETISISLPDKYILAIGRLNRVKRFDKLIRSFGISQCKDTHHLIILGKGNESSSLQQLINDLNLEKRVHLLGHVDNVFPYIAKASIGAISSDVEGFPNVLLQMYALNLRVVMTRCCGGLETFPELYLCKENTEKELACLLDSASQERADIDFSDFIKKYDIHDFVNQVEGYV
ncbi:glycosyltransferase [Sphingobacterium suaedae]|uniref:Glycosyltransferase n=1 Tax=Sphingobacterium suaedae TaxID=1686402 RepID=A0ABW5KKC6_9SPHI